MNECQQATSGKPDAQTEKMVQEAIYEARMVLPGIQALFGFQLIAVFNERFKQLTASEQHLHLTAIILIAMAVAVIMTPAAYHRQVEPGSVSRQFVKLASRLVTAAMVPLMLGLCLDVYLLALMILGGSAISMAIATGLFALFGALWFVFPQIMRRARGMER